MSLLVDQTQTSSAPLTGHPQADALATGLLIDAVFGTSAGVAFRSLGSDVFGVTTVPQTRERTSADVLVADELRALRDVICATGISRLQLARLLGVDRRSLSGWASGEIRPAPGRVEALRATARAVADIESERPGRVPEVLMHARGTTTLLDAAVAGRIRLDRWRSWLARSGALSTVVPRLRAAQPIWAAAARALAEGRLEAPSRQPTVRPAAIYEVNPDDEAALFAEPEHEGGRRGYR